MVDLLSDSDGSPHVSSSSSKFAAAAAPSSSTIFGKAPSAAAPGHEKPAAQEAGEKGHAEKDPPAAVAHTAEVGDWVQWKRGKVFGDGEATMEGVVMAKKNRTCRAVVMVGQTTVCLGRFERIDILPGFGGGGHMLKVKVEYESTMGMGLVDTMTTHVPLAAVTVRRDGNEAVSERLLQSPVLSKGPPPPSAPKRIITAVICLKSPCDPGAVSAQLASQCRPGKSSQRLSPTRWTWISCLWRWILRKRKK